MSISMIELVRINGTDVTLKHWFQQNFPWLVLQMKSNFSYVCSGKNSTCGISFIVLNPKVKSVVTVKI